MSTASSTCRRATPRWSSIREPGDGELETLVAKDKETRVIDGRECVLEQAIIGDVALVEAWRADRWGNLVYRDAGRNFNPVCAAAGKLTIVQTQNIAELGELTPEMIVTPGIYVDRAVHIPSGDPPVVIS